MRKSVTDLKGCSVYSGKTAFKFEERIHGEHTLLAIEGAQAEQTAFESGKKFNWNDKVRLHVVAKELPECCGVLLGIIEKAEFKFHGPDKNKSYYFLNSGKDLLINVSEQGRSITGKIQPSDKIYVTSLFLNTLSGLCLLPVPSVIDILKSNYFKI